MDKEPEKKPKLSKRAVLYITVILLAVICIGAVFYISWRTAYWPIPEFIIIFFVLVILSLIVYYLSIIADAMAANVKGKKELKEKDEKQNKIK